MDKLILPDDHVLCINTFLDRISLISPIKDVCGVVHVGAHMGEEVSSYLAYGYCPVYLVEANPEITPKLTAKFSNISDVHVTNVAISDKNGIAEIIIHQTQKGGVESSGLLPLKKLGEIVPVFNSEKKYQIPSTTLDQFAEDLNLHGKIKLLTIDIQGAELMALSGAATFFRSVDAVICEVNLIESYENCPLEKDIDDFFLKNNFIKELAIYHELYNANGKFPAWGECLWIRNKNRNHQQI